MNSPTSHDHHRHDHVCGRPSLPFSDHCALSLKSAASHKKFDGLFLSFVLLCFGSVDRAAAASRGSVRRAHACFDHDFFSRCDYRIMTSLKLTDLTRETERREAAQVVVGGGVCAFLLFRLSLVCVVYQHVRRFVYIFSARLVLIFSLLHFAFFVSVSCFVCFFYNRCIIL